MHMFSYLKVRLLLGIYILIIISIPIGAYLASQQTSVKSKAQEPKSTVKSSPVPNTSPVKELQRLSESALDQSAPSASPTVKGSEGTVATSFGPTLSLKVNFEGRPKDNQAAKLFVGIVEGTISLNPKFLLSFTIDLPKSGEYSGLSLAGLTPGQSFTALLKGPAQIASASAFIMSPTVTNLNNGQAITLLSGDLNEDNTINTSDYSIAQKAFGATSTSLNWNENIDFNKDSIINSLDLVFITKNFGKVGDSGAWTSPLPTATPSASLSTPPVGGTDSESGYWIWVPKLTN